MNGSRGGNRGASGSSVRGFGSIHSGRGAGRSPLQPRPSAWTRNRRLGRRKPLPIENRRCYPTSSIRPPRDHHLRDQGTPGASAEHLETHHGRRCGRRSRGHQTRRRHRRSGITRRTCRRWRGGDALTSMHMTLLGGASRTGLPPSPSGPPRLLKSLPTVPAHAGHRSSAHRHQILGPFAGSGMIDGVVDDP